MYLQSAWPHMLTPDSWSVIESDTDEGGSMSVSRYFPPVGTTTEYKRDLDITDLDTARVRVLSRKERRVKG